MSTAVAKIEPQKRSLLADMASRYGMEPQAFANTLKATVVPPKTSNEEFAAFLLVAKEYDLNPLTKEIYAFPKQGGGIQPIVSVDGWANLINSHPQCDGFEFKDNLDENGKLISITCRIYRKDRAHPVEATEYMDECTRGTSTWKQWPRRMLRHKALIQAARYAFGFAGIVDPDEAERGHYGNAPGPRLTPPSAPVAPPVAAPREAVEPEPEDDSVEGHPELPPIMQRGDWLGYLDRQRDEYAAADDAGAKYAVCEAVQDSITGAQERGDINSAEAEELAEAWNNICGEVDG